jgi:hypothetical protein
MPSERPRPASPRPRPGEVFAPPNDFAPPLQGAKSMGRSGMVTTSPRSEIVSSTLTGLRPTWVSRSLGCAMRRGTIGCLAFLWDAIGGMTRLM